MALWRAQLPVFSLLALVGCFGNETTVFPEGLEPLEEVTVAPPEALPGDPWPETANLRVGEAAFHDWAMLRGYIHAPLAEVYAAMTEPPVCVDRRAVDVWSFEIGVEPAYEHSFVIHNEVRDIITVNFDITWRFGLVQGTSLAPTLVAGAFQKTWGTTFIPKLKGSLTASAVNNTVTEITIVEHLRASGGGTAAIGAFLQDLYASIVAQSHGQPLPVY